MSNRKIMLNLPTNSKNISKLINNIILGLLTRKARLNKQINILTDLNNK